MVESFSDFKPSLELASDKKLISLWKNKNKKKAALKCFVSCVSDCWAFSGGYVGDVLNGASGGRNGKKKDPGDFMLGSYHI